jgi:hypothetical protein
MGQKINWYYNSREERAKWIVERFSDIFNNAESVLDVGCWKKDIKKYLSNDIRYMGIDIAGNPDIYLDLDKIDRLPFNDNSFDVVVCADVLEHLENIHLIFDEMCRVSKRFVIITLPNPANQVFNYLFGRKYAKDFEKRKKFGKYSKFYGLPLEKPEDRHRWFFSYDEAIEFIEYRAKKNGFNINITEDDIKYKTNFKFSIINIVKKILYIHNPNLVVQDIIVLLEKGEIR